MAYLKRTIRSNPYFRFKPLLLAQENGFEAVDSTAAYPEDGCIRIVPDEKRIQPLQKPHAPHGPLLRGRPACARRVKTIRFAPTRIIESTRASTTPISYIPTWCARARAGAELRNCRRDLRRAVDGEICPPHPARSADNRRISGALNRIPPVRATAPCRAVSILLKKTFSALS